MKTRSHSFAKFNLFFSYSKISEVESNPPDEEKKAINSFYDATSYNLNGDYFDSQVSIQISPPRRRLS